MIVKDIPRLPPVWDNNLSCIHTHTHTHTRVCVLKSNFVHLCILIIYNNCRCLCVYIYIYIYIYIYHHHQKPASCCNQAYSNDGNDNTEAPDVTPYITKNFFFRIMMDNRLGFNSQLSPMRHYSLC